MSSATWRNRSRRLSATSRQRAWAWSRSFSAKTVFTTALTTGLLVLPTRASRLRWKCTRQRCQPAPSLGVAKRMLTHLLARQACAGITTLKTTITADNDASWELFNSFADRMDGDLGYEAHYKRDNH